MLDWSDARAHALAADNLFLDQPLAERQEALQALREGLGRCSAGALKPENALRGTQRLDCEQGWIDIELTVAPVAEVLEGDGESRATLALACERGLLRMSLSAEQGRLSKLALRPDPGPACLP